MKIEELQRQLNLCIQLTELDEEREYKNYRIKSNPIKTIIYFEKKCNCCNDETLIVIVIEFNNPQQILTKNQQNLIISIYSYFLIPIDYIGNKEENKWIENIKSIKINEFN